LEQASVLVARSVVDAHILGERSVSFALLDVNPFDQPAGRKNAAGEGAVCSARLRRGDRLAGTGMAGVPVISEPYHQAAIVSVLMQWFHAWAFPRLTPPARRHRLRAARLIATAQTCHG
jgi:hypothetical protein